VSTPSLLDQLRTVHHFRSLPDAELSAILSSGNILRVPAGKILFRELEECGGMHVLIKGQVHLTKLGPQGQENIIAIIQPVIMFNEVAVLDGGTNPVTATALQDSLLWRIGCGEFQALLEKIPMVGISLLRVLASRNRMLMAHYEDLAFRTVLGRTAKLLLDLSQNGKQPVQRSEHSIQEMASRVASVPEAISRSLNLLKNDGVIESSRTVIYILQPDKLAEIAQMSLGLPQ
jgi:CRP/FNR family transcriptional regulator